MEKGETSQARDAVYCIQRITRGKRKGSPFVLKGREVVVGRHPSAEIKIDSEDVSRRHAVLTKSGCSWSVHDHKSGNGVWVNRKQLAPNVPCKLAEGDVFSLGSPKTTDYVYVFSQHEENCSSHHLPSSKASVRQIVEETQERVRKLTDKLESTLQEKQQVEKQLEVQQKRFKTSQKQEKELDHLAKSLRNQLKRQKKEERKLQKELQARQKACDKSQKQEKKLQSQLKKRKKSQDELVKKLRSQKKELLESRKEQKNLKQQLDRKKVTGRKKKQPQEIQKENLVVEPSTSTEGELRNTAKGCYYVPLKDHSDMKPNFKEIFQTQMNCSICSEVFIQAQTLGCSHTFCRHCIMLWRQKKNECPICRAPIRSMVHALVMDNFIDQVIANMSPQLREHRMDLARERGPSTSSIGVNVNFEEDDNTMLFEGSSSSDSHHFEYSSSDESDSLEDSSSDESESSENDSSSEETDCMEDSSSNSEDESSDSSSSLDSSSPMEEDSSSD